MVNDSGTLACYDLEKVSYAGKLDSTKIRIVIDGCDQIFEFGEFSRRESYFSSLVNALRDLDRNTDCCTTASDYTEGGIR